MPEDIQIVAPSTPISQAIDTFNQNDLKNKGKAVIAQFNKNEIDQIFDAFFAPRRWKREVGLGNTLSTFTQWTHVKDNDGYAIWKIAVGDYSHNDQNNIYFDDVQLENRGEATSESATSFSKVFEHDGSEFTDLTTEADSEFGEPFSVLSAKDTRIFYIGSDTPFNGIDFSFETLGLDITLSIQYSKGSDAWDTPQGIVDETVNFTRSGRLQFSQPQDFAKNTVNGQEKYWVKLTTTTAPVIFPYAYYVKPLTSVVNLLSLSADQILQRQFAWVSYNGNVYVTLPNTGNTQAEGEAYVKSSSSQQNKENYFVSNHQLKSDHESFNYTITSGGFVTSIDYMPELNTPNDLNLKIRRGRSETGNTYHEHSNTSLLLDADTDKTYIFVDENGVLTKNTTGFPIVCYPIAEIKTDSTKIIELKDRRVFINRKMDPLYVSQIGTETKRIPTIYANEIDAVTYKTGETVALKDNIWVINSDKLTGTPTENMGFLFKRGDSQDAEFYFKEADDRFNLNFPINIQGLIRHEGNLVPSTSTLTIGTSSNRYGALYLNSMIDYASDLIFQSGGATKAVLKTSGVFGLGTDSPTERFQLYGGNFALENQYKLILNHSAGGNNYLQSPESSSSRLGIFTANSERVSILYSNGFVGIGTVSPNSKLTVVGSGEFSTSVITPAISPLTIGTALSISTIGGSSSTGSITIQSGNLSGNGGTTGTILIKAGTSSTSDGGYLSLGGYPNYNQGGGVTLRGGDSWANAGAVTIRGGNAGSGKGGDIVLQGGNGGSGLGGAGSITLNAGSGGSLSPGNLIFKINNIEHARLHNSGNFGVGTNSPDDLFTVAASAATPIISIQRSSSLWEAQLRFKTGTSVDWIFFENDSGNDLQIQRISELDSAPRLKFSGSNNDILMALSGGNVGIGLTPSVRFHVSGTSRFEGNVDINVVNGSSKLSLKASGNNDGIQFFNQSGNLIGTWYQTQINNGSHLQLQRAGVGTRIRLSSDTSLTSYFLDPIGMGTASPDTSYAVHIGSPGLKVNAQSGSNGLYVYRDDTELFNRIIFDTTRQYSEWGSKPIVFKQGNAERFRLDEAGNFGLGIDSPQALLHVRRTGATTDIRLDSELNQLSLIVFAEAGTTKSAMGYDSTNDIFKINGLGSNFTANHHLTINSIGNVGIGTSSPSTTLDVIGSSSATTIRIKNTGAIFGASILELDSKGNSSGAIYFTNDSTNKWFLFNDPSDNNSFRLRNGNNDEILYVKSSGEVGIGTATPSGKLDVNGNIFVRQNIRFPNEGDILNNGSSGSGHWQITQDSTFNFIAQTWSDRYFKFNGATFRQSGNVGIGTINPGVPLHVFHATNNSVATFESGDSGVNIRLVDSNTTNVPILEVVGNQIQFSHVSGGAKVVITDTGLMGIGTTSPTYKLDISAANSGINITGGNSRIYFGGYRAIEGTQDGSSLQFGESYSHIYLRNSGYVSIGHVNPESELDIQGSSLTGVTATVSKIRAGTGIGKRAGYTISTSNGGPLGGITAEVVTDGVYPNTVGKLDVWVQNLNNSFKAISIDQNTFVGIGTSAPSDKLHVANGAIQVKGVHTGQADSDWGSLAGQDVFSLMATRQQNGTPSALGGYGMVFDGGYESPVLYCYDAPGNKIVFGSLSSIGGRNLAADLKPFAVFNADNGRVGFGTVDPQDMLHIVNPIGNSQIRLERASGARLLLAAQAANTQVGSLTNHGMQLVTNGNARITIDSSGRVGIGDTTPTSPLTISLAGNRTLSLNILGVTAPSTYTWQSLNTNSSERWRIVGRENTNTVAEDTSLEFWDANSTRVLTLLQGGNISVGATTNMEGRIHLKSGSTATGGLTFQSSSSITNYFSLNLNSDDNLGFVTWVSPSWVERFTFTKDGRFGIGTTSPSEKLTIENGFFMIQSTGGGTRFRLSTNGGVSQVDSLDAGIPLSFNTQAVERMRITAGGLVGIGTTNPHYKLSVAGGIFNVEKNGDYYGFWVEDKARDDNPKVNIGEWHNSRGGISYDSTGNFLTFDTEQGTTVYSHTLVLKDGKVGIGVTSPARALEINKSGGCDLEVASILSGPASIMANGYSNSTNLATVSGGGKLSLQNLDGTNNNYSSISFLDNGGQVTSAIVAVNENHLTNAGVLTFHYRPGSGNLTEGARLTSSGDFAIYNQRKLIINQSAGGNNYLLSPENDTSRLGIFTAGAERISIAYSTGYIGFRGETSPDVPFHFVGKSGDVSVGGESIRLQTVTSPIGNDPILSIGLKDEISGKGYAWIRAVSADGSTTADLSLMTTPGGNVGIGTTTPQTHLHLYSASGTGYKDQYADFLIEGEDSRLQLMSTNAGVNGSALILSNVNTSWTFHQRTASLGNRLDIGYYTATGIADIASGQSPKLTILPSGHIGIGKNDPGSMLDIRGTGAIFRAGRSNVSTIGEIVSWAMMHNWEGTDEIGVQFDSVIIDNSNLSRKADLVIRTQNQGISERVRIKYNGRVGIGTNDPLEKLHIYDGDILLSSGRSVRGPGGAEMIRFNTTNGVQINSGGSERLRIDTNGNVYLGPVSGNFRFRIAGTSGEQNLLISGESVSPSTNAALYVASGNVAQSILYMGDNNNLSSGKIIYDQSNNSYRIHTNTVERLRITSDGKIGVGTSSPNEILTVEGTTSLKSLSSSPLTTSGYGKLYVKSSDGNLYFKTPSGVEKNLFTSAGTPWTFNGSGIFYNAGKVGIGTTTPVSTLHVYNALNDSSANSFHVGEGTHGLFVGNGTTGGMIPFVIGRGYDSGDQCLYLSGEATASNDTGIVPVVVIGGRRTTQSEIQTRPILSVQNYSAKLMTILADGKIGIGISNPDAKLEVNNTSTNSSSKTGYFVTTKQSTSNGTYYNRGVNILSKIKVNSGVNDSGDYIGIYNISERTESDDQGTLNLIYGHVIHHGHGSGVNLSAITQGSRGLQISPHYAAGTISNVYDLYINAPETGGTLSNTHYSIYQAYSGSVNYFAGKVGVGTSSPTHQVHIKGTNPKFKIESNGATELAQFQFTRSDGSWAIGAETGSARKFIIWDSVNGYQFAISGMNTGIGTTNPRQKLEVNSGSGNNGILINAGAPRLTFETNSATHYNWRVAAQDIIDAGFEIQVGNQDADATNDSYSVVFSAKQSGNIGLGINHPENRLHLPWNERLVCGQGSYSGYSGGATVWGTQNGTYGWPGFIGRNLWSNGTNYYQASSNSSQNWGTSSGILFTGTDPLFRIVTIPSSENGTDYNLGTNLDTYTRLVINSAGRVGIGTTSPQSGYACTVYSPGLYVDATSGSQGLYIYRHNTELFNRIQFDSTRQYSDWGTRAIVFRQGGTERLRIHEGGAIGINTTSPTSKLHIVDGNNTVRIGDLQSSTAGIELTDTNPVYMFGWGSSIRFATGGSSSEYHRMIVDSSGYVGIGTMAPAAMLVVEDDSGVIIKSPTSGYGQLKIKPYAPGHTYHEFFAGSWENIVFNIASNANFGIGTTAPSAKLHVNGSIRAGTHPGSSPQAALELVSGGSGNYNNPVIALRQVTTEADTRIFADFGEHVGWGIYHRNSDNTIHFTNGAGSGFETWSEPAPTGGNDSVGSRFRINLGNGNTAIGGRVTIGDYHSAPSQLFYVRDDFGGSGPGTLVRFQNDHSASSYGVVLDLFHTNTLDSDYGENSAIIRGGEGGNTKFYVTNRGAGYFDGMVNIGNMRVQREHRVTGLSLSSTGWYRVAKISGSAGRGQNTVTINTTGGDHDPRSVTIRWWHNWSTLGALSAISEYGNGYWSDARVTDDGSNSYLEVYFTHVLTYFEVTLQLDGGQAAGEVLSSPQSGGGTVRATTKLGKFSIGSGQFHLTSGSYVGIGTESPATHVHIYDSSGISQGALRVHAGSGEATLGLGTGSSTWSSARRAFVAFEGWSLSSYHLGIGSASFPAIDINTSNGDVGLRRGLTVGNTSQASNMGWTNPGITINYSTNATGSTGFLAAKNPDVSHGVTSITSTDAFLFMEEWNMDMGGVGMWGIGESSIVGVSICGVNTSPNTATSSSATGQVQVIGYKKSGSGLTGLGADDNTFVVKSWGGNARQIFKGDGDIYTDTGGVGSFDAEDDIKLVETARNMFDGKQVLKKYKDRLEELGILKNGFMSNNKMHSLNLGALGQLFNVIRGLAKKLGVTEEELLKMAKEYA